MDNEIREELRIIKLLINEINENLNNLRIRCDRIESRLKLIEDKQDVDKRKGN